MAAARRHLATTPRCLGFAAAASRVFERIGCHLSAAVLPMITRPSRAKALIVVVASALCASPAWSAGGVVKGIEWNSGPRCNDPAVVDQIVAEYRSRHWASGFEDIHTGKARWKSWPHHVRPPRRFCEGQIKAWRGPELLTYPIYYAIIADDPSYRLAWCVVGLDRPWPYDPRCRLARP